MARLHIRGTEEICNMNTSEEEVPSIIEDHNPFTAEGCQNMATNWVIVENYHDTHNAVIYDELEVLNVTCDRND